MTEIGRPAPLPTLVCGAVQGGTDPPTINANGVQEGTTANRPRDVANISASDNKGLGGKKR